VTFAPIIQTYIAQTGSRTTTLTVTLPATTQLYIFNNDTGSSAYNIQFQIQGSAQPPLVVGNGNIATVLSDGQNLYILTSSTSNIFYAVNGIATAPSFSFISDATTGMYLVGANILGFAANGVQIANMDNTNTLLPKMKVNATLTADLISGGTF
jgi:type 1 fimbria pilin